MCGGEGGGWHRRVGGVGGEAAAEEPGPLGALGVGAGRAAVGEVEGDGGGGGRAAGLGEGEEAPAAGAGHGVEGVEPCDYYYYYDYYDYHYCHDSCHDYHFHDYDYDDGHDHDHDCISAQQINKCDCVPRYTLYHDCFIRSNRTNTNQEQSYRGRDDEREANIIIIIQRKSVS